MKLIRMFTPLLLAGLVTVSTAVLTGRVEAARRAPQASTSTPSKRDGYRQFTGTVVAMDGASLTVERGGRTARQMVFTRGATMRSTGELQKQSRVTVYWRDEAGQPVAHRVVVRPSTGAGSR